MDGKSKEIVGIEELTERETKRILLLHGRCNYADAKQVSQVCELLDKKKLLHTPSGKRYETALFSLKEDAYSSTNCIYCAGELNSKEHVICGQCEKRLRRHLKAFQGKAISKSEPTEYGQKKRNKRKKNKHLVIGAAIGIGIILLAAVILVFVALHKSEVLTEAKFTDTFKAGLAESGLTLGEAIPVEQDSTAYEIIQAEASDTVETSEADTVSPNYLLTFFDNRKKLTGAALQLSGTSEQSRYQHLMLMSVVADALYEKLSQAEVEQLLGELFNANGRMAYDGYEWMLATGENETMLLVMDESLLGTDLDATQSLSEANAEVDFSMEQLGEQDVMRLLGEPYAVAEEILGSSVSVIAENTRYFEASGVSLVYNEESREVIYLDCDNSGSLEEPTVLCGLRVGDAQASIKETLSGYGLTEPFYEDDEIQTYRFLWNGSMTELTVNVLDGEICLVCVKKITTN